MKEVTEFVYETKDKSIDSIDPVESFDETETHFYIHNGLYLYDVPKADVTRWIVRRRRSIDESDFDTPFAALEGEPE